MAIVIEGLKYSWDARVEKPILDIHELKISAGEKVFVEGPSGSGKTTLLGLLGGVLVPQTGSVSVLDHQLMNLSGFERDKFRANHVGFIFQMFNLLPYLNVIDNVSLALKFSPRKLKRLQEANTCVDTEAQRLLSALGLRDKSLYETSISNLSVGQQQRVAAARALIGRPEIVIADEPTSALDADSCEEFMSLLLNECEKSHSTLIFVSHDQSLSKHFDRKVKISELSSSHGLES